VYSVTNVAGLTYTWTVPSGSSITSGQGTNLVTITLGTMSGNIQVIPSNLCGNGPSSSMVVTPDLLPYQPSTLSGQSAPCQGSLQTYSVSEVAGVTYNWTVPSGSTITAGQGSNSISLTIGSTNGIIEVMPGNACGNGISRTLAVTVSDVPGIASTPIGPSIVDLAYTNTSNYSTPGASNANSYQWDLTPVAAGTIVGNGLSATVTWVNYLGLVDIRVKAINACGEGTWSAVKTTQVINTTGIQHVRSEEVSVFPSPSHGTFTVDLSGKTGEGKMKIYSTTGKELFSRTIVANSAVEVDTQLTPGVYILVIELNGETLKSKLLIR
jgi:hypothetical protein